MPTGFQIQVTSVRDEGEPIGSAVNVKGIDALDIDFPATLLGRANDVIE
jgi:hypothetical protein